MQTVQERRHKSGLQQVTRNLEQEYGEKILRKALGDSAEKCLRGSEERKYRFGSSFSVGDHVATSELSLIMVNIQMQVTSTLQQLASSADMPFDAARLHEAVITAKSNTLRSMDELCQRIVYRSTQGRMVRHSGSLLDLAHPNTSLFSIHDSVVDQQNRPLHKAALPLDISKQRRHTMAGIAEHQQQAQNDPAPALAWPTSSTASSCRSVSSDSSLSCRSSVSSPINPPPRPRITEKRQSIPEATPIIDRYEPILRRKSMRSAFLRRPSKPTLHVPVVVHPAYREKLHVTSTTALLPEKPDHIWSPIAIAFNRVLGRVATRCKKLGA